MDGSKGIATLVCQQCSACKSVYDLLINVSQQQKFEIQNVQTIFKNNRLKTFWDQF